MAEERAAESAVRGFILQATYRVQGAAAVVHLYGALEQGGSFLVRDHRQRPSFHVARDDAEAAWRLGATRQFETANATFDGRRAVRVEVGIPSDAPPLRDRLEAQDIRTFEADVRFATRYLIDRDIRGGCAISGAWTPGEHISRIYDDPVLRPAEVRMAPSVLSFDIETDMDAKRLLAIALYGQFGGGEAQYTVDEVLVVDRAGRAMPERAVGFADEKQALAAFAARVRELDPDVLTGWNVVDFDLNVLARIAKRLRVPLHLGRDEGGVRVRPAQGYFGSGQASIPGRVVLDGMDLVRGAYQRFDDYSLDGVASAVLGEGKVALGSTGPESNRARAILARYQGRPAHLRRLRPHRCATGAGDRGGTRPRHAGHRAQPAHRHDAGPRGGEHRVVRLPLSFGIAQAPRGGAVGAFQRCGRLPSPPGWRPRLRAGRRPARQRVGVRLQEPLSERHPHLQHRPARLFAPRSRFAFRRHGAPRRRRRVQPRRSDSAGDSRPPLSAAGSGQAGWRRHRVPSREDSDELLLRRPRHPRLPLPQRRHRQRHHRHGPPPVAVGEGLVRATRLARAVRRHGQRVRPFRHGLGSGAGRRGRGWRGS